MYEPAEDSHLIEKYVKKLASGRVLEIGAGSVILMEAALKKSKNVEGVDVDDESLKYCRKKRLNVKKSNLFENVKGKFDFIIFNPPYSPELNPIETCWKVTKNAVTKSQHFKTTEVMQMALEEFWNRHIFTQNFIRYLCR